MRRVACLIAVCLLLVACQEKKMDRFEREAKDFTEKNCPQQLDAVTTLDSMVFEKDGDEGTLRLYYTLNFTEEERGRFMDVLTDVGEENLSMVKNSLQLVKYKEAGVRFSYIYHDALTGDKLVQYDFSRKDYE